MTRTRINTKQGEPSAPRKLRSKETPKIDSSLFNYEENPNIIDPDQRIFIVDKKEVGEVLQNDIEVDQKSFSFETNLKTADDLNNKKNGSSKRRKLRKSTITRQQPTDPLNDELYIPYNRRMEKEEKKMINWEREKIYSEADKMKAQLEKLHQNDWMKSLQTITYIRDPRDHKEMMEKKEWTIESLKGMLKRFEDWKRCEDRVLGRIRASSPSLIQHPFKYYTNMPDADLVQDSDTDEDENNMTIPQIRRLRLRKKLEKFGPIIKVKFGTKVIIAEPFKATRIENR